MNTLSNELEFIFSNNFDVSLKRTFKIIYQSKFEKITMREIGRIHKISHARVEQIIRGFENKIINNLSDKNELINLFESIKIGNKLQKNFSINSWIIDIKKNLDIGEFSKNF